MSSAGDKNSWYEYSKLVLSELERLDDAQKETKKEINAKLDQLLALNQTVVDLKKWKEEKAEVDIQTLKEFRIQTKTYGVISEIIIAGVVSLIISKLTGGH